jgi:hypothetical protein
MPDRRVVRPTDNPTSPAAVAAVFEPELTLIGVAEQPTAAGLVRTAMIAGPGDELLMVVEGQQIGGRYRVSAVGADAVELQDLATGATRRLVLKSGASPL